MECGVVGFRAQLDAVNLPYNILKQGEYPMVRPSICISYPYKIISRQIAMKNVYRLPELKQSG